MEVLEYEDEEERKIFYSILTMSPERPDILLVFSIWAITNLWPFIKSATPKTCVWESQKVSDEDY